MSADLIDHEKLVEYLFSAIPEHKRGKMPYEDCVAILASRWCQTACRCNSDNWFIMFLILWYTTQNRIPFFSERTQQQIHQQFHPRVSIEERVYDLWKKQVPIEVIYPFLSDDIRKRVEVTVKMIGMAAWTYCSDIHPQDLHHVIHSKSTTPKLLC